MIRIILLLMLLSACSPMDSAPKEQLKFEAKLNDMRDSYDNVLSTHSDILTERFEDKARYFYRTRRVVRGWVGKVEYVGSKFGFTRLHVKNGYVSYSLRARETSGIHLYQFMRGEIVKFSGTITGEASITMSGAMDKPHFSIEIFKLEHY